MSHRRLPPRRVGRSVTGARRCRLRRIEMRLHYSRAHDGAIHFAPRRERATVIIDRIAGGRTEVTEVIVSRASSAESPERPRTQSEFREPPRPAARGSLEGIQSVRRVHATPRDARGGSGTVHALWARTAPQEHADVATTASTRPDDGSIAVSQAADGEPPRRDRHAWGWCTQKLMMVDSLTARETACWARRTRC